MFKRTSAADYRWLALPGLLLLTALAYWPGLAGPFVLDDFSNLNALGAFGPIDNGQTLLYYLTSGQADPTGRPLALASFLIDAQHWPAEPWPFKRTNLLLHLLNGALLFATLRVLQRQINPDSASAWRVALLACALWLAHPFLVSTTLYVVQRQAMLPFTFAMLALLAWDRAYRLSLADRRAAAWAVAIFGVGGATLLAGLSKANGLLIPLLVWLTHAIVYSKPDSPPHRATRRLVAVTLALPALAVIIAVLSRLQVGLDYHGLRPWTLGERLLSQPRALLSYLGQLLLPQASSHGPYQDAFVASTGWLTPWTTLPALLLVMASLVAAITLRKRYPIVSFALGFFFAAHLMESGPLMLELYFEHRNYLPAAFVFWPIAHGLVGAAHTSKLRLLWSFCLPLILLVLTLGSARLWGQQERMAARWESANPTSPRASAAHIDSLAQSGRLADAAAIAIAAAQRMPDSSDIALKRIGAECSKGHVTERAIASAEANLAIEVPLGLQVFSQWMTAVTRMASAGQCAGLTLAQVERLALAFERNPRIESSPALRQLAWRVRGTVAAASGDPAKTADLFSAAVRADPSPAALLALAETLVGLDQPELAKGLLARHRAEVRQRAIPWTSMAGLHQRLLRRSGYYDRAFARLDTALQERTGPASLRITEPLPATVDRSPDQH